MDKPALKTIVPANTLDLRTTKCPLNFVKAKLAIEKLAVAEVLEIWLLPGAESALNIPKSMVQEGHTLLHDVLGDDGVQRLYFRREP